MKQIRDEVGGLDVRRDGVVVCGRRPDVQFRSPPSAPPPPDRRPPGLSGPLQSSRSPRGSARASSPSPRRSRAPHLDPGISDVTAKMIVAEAGTAMTRFPTPGHLCAWAGVAPASYESAGKRTRLARRPADLDRDGAGGGADQGSYCSAQYSRTARRRGPNKTAVAHSVLGPAWHLLSTSALYQVPGADYFERRHDPAVEAKRLQRRIEALGFAVTITEDAA